MGEYTFPVGEVAVTRLTLVDECYGPASRAWLTWAGLRPGMRVLEVGCGPGDMACWLAEQVGPGGIVVCVDSSPEQLRCARLAAERRGLHNLQFVCSSAYALAEAGRGFDLAYSRLLLMHLEDPLAALREMRAALGADGQLVCEEIAVASSFCRPTSAAQLRLQTAGIQLGRLRHCDFDIGENLFALAQRAGLRVLRLARYQPMLLAGPTKAIELLSFREIGQRLLQTGLLEAQELEQLLNELTRLVEDETTMYALSCMTQVCGTH